MGVRCMVDTALYGAVSSTVWDFRGGNGQIDVLALALLFPIPLFHLVCG